MKCELDNFIIESDIELNYFNEVVEYIKDNSGRILEFFNLDKSPHKVNILIMSYKPFKEFIVSKYGEILDYISGDSESMSHSIRVLNVEDQKKYTIHKNANVDVIKTTILHEIVHQCHHIYHTDFNQITWFSEGLATVLAEPRRELVKLSECDFEKLKTDFRHYKGSYGFAHTIVSFILNNYSKEEIEKLYSNPDYLRVRSNDIFKKAKEMYG